MAGAAKLDASSTTDDALRGVDLAGKLALITGASGGLGLETARALASAGAQVVLAARDPAKTDAALRSVRDAVPGARVEGGLLDLASLASVRSFAAEFVARHDRLHLLINNAGVMATPLRRTADGFELQLGTNHLGHFLLTGLLSPALLAAAPARIVNLSSGGHMIAGIDWDDPNFERRAYDKWASYGQSKTANVLLTVELERRLGTRGVHAYAVHPGMILTDLGRHLAREDIETLSAMAKRGSESTAAGTGAAKDGERRGSGLPGFKTIPQGAATTIWAATAGELEGRGGSYLADCAVSSDHAAWAVDPEGAKRLWALSERLVGQAFPL